MKTNTTARPYYADKGASTAFYDVVTEADQALLGDLEIYANLTPPKGSVLEIGAGTGRISIGLAHHGFDVVGLDIAPAMLTQAQAKRAQLDPIVADRLRLVRGDMTSFSLGQRFDAIFATFYTLAHVPPGAAWRNTFNCVSKHLKPGGVAAFHLPVAAKMSAEAPSPNVPVFRRDLEDGRVLTLYVASQTMRADIGRMDLCVDYVLSRGGSEQRHRERLTLYDGDPGPFAEQAGLVAERAPIPLGGVGLIHVFRAARD